MRKMEGEDPSRESDSQGNEPVRRRSYRAPVLERHDEWHLVTGIMTSAKM